MLPLPCRLFMPTRTLSTYHLETRGVGNKSALAVDLDPAESGDQQQKPVWTRFAKVQRPGRRAAPLGPFSIALLFQILLVCSCTRRCYAASHLMR